MNPIINMTTALNQLICVPHLLTADEFRWIRHPKALYILKSPRPTTPSDYCPLSMLEVRYKISSCNLYAHLSWILPTVIGPHQHGFMAYRSHPLVSKCMPLQQASSTCMLWHEKSFWQVGHLIIIQALRAFSPFSHGVGHIGHALLWRQIAKQNVNHQNLQSPSRFQNKVSRNLEFSSLDLGTVFGWWFRENAITLYEGKCWPLSNLKISYLLQNTFSPWKVIKFTQETDNEGHLSNFPLDPS